MTELDAGLASRRRRGFIVDQIVPDVTAIRSKSTIRVWSRTRPSPRVTLLPSTDLSNNVQLGQDAYCGSGSAKTVYQARQAVQNVRDSLRAGPIHCCGRLGGCPMVLVQRKSSAWQGKGQSVEARIPCRAESLTCTIHTFRLPPATSLISEAVLCFVLSVCAARPIPMALNQLMA